jgi:hypothetical protein
MEYIEDEGFRKILILIGSGISRDEVSLLLSGELGAGILPTDPIEPL